MMNDTRSSQPISYFASGATTTTHMIQFEMGHAQQFVELFYIFFL
jgi:hypothetical protein